MGRTIGSQTIQATTGTTAQTSRLPDQCTMILLKSPTTNADNIYIKIDDVTADTGDIILRPGDCLSMDISDALLLKLKICGIITPDDFYNLITYKASANTPTLEIDAFGFNLPMGCL